MKSILTLAVAGIALMGVTACSKAEAGYTVTPKVGYVTRTNQEATLVDNKDDLVYGVGISRTIDKDEALEIEYLKNNTDYEVQTININGYKYFDGPYFMGGVGYSMPEIGKDQALVQVGVGFRSPYYKTITPKLELRHTYHLTDKTQDTAVLGGFEYKF